MQMTFDRLCGRAVLIWCAALALHAQAFPSGSTGVDGDLIVNTPGVTVYSAVPSGGGSVYNFKTIQIAAGSTLKLSGAVFPGPLYFLAQGAVTIAGIIDLSGQSSTQSTSSAQRTVPSIPGAGGYAGGSGALGTLPGSAGLGPLGGGAGTNFSRGTAGGFSGNQFLVPLIGGSGGGGDASPIGLGGGAGGGAILIASSVSISVTGTITAVGGAGSGGGSGGGIRLVAPAISGSGTITAAGGAGAITNTSGASGVVRLEFFQSTFTGTTGGTLYTATPVNVFAPAANSQPYISVTSIGGIAVPANSTGSFVVPDVLLNSTSALTVNIQAVNVPLGTIPTVYFSTENFPDQRIAANAGLTGTLASSTTSATVTLKPGFSIGFVTATWSQ